MSLARISSKAALYSVAFVLCLCCWSCGTSSKKPTGRNNKNDSAPAQAQQGSSNSATSNTSGENAAGANGLNSLDETLRRSALNSATPSPSPSVATNANGAQGTGASGATVVDFNSRLNVSGPTSCRIKISQCPAQTTVKTGVFFEDNFEGASNDSKRCLKRATDYATWCELPVPLAATAHFVQGDVLLAQSSGMRDGCRVLVEKCPAQPSLTTIGVFFRDDFENASSNKDRCLARAKDFVTWCGTPTGFGATAQFQKDGVVETKAEKVGN